jgi:cation diffusion facilitator CzcD-associated flavoprotein CzcO
MKIGVIGAGFAGLSAVKVLREFGHDVIAFERAPDVGGVWSRTRRYPGLETQNNKDSYCFSDFPMPKEYPEWPTGAQVQQYLAAYVEHFRLGAHIRLSTEVIAAEPTAAGWELSTVNAVTGATDSVQVDYLVVANGIFSYPLVPSSPVRTSTTPPADASATHPRFTISTTSVASTWSSSAMASLRATSPRRSARPPRAPSWSPAS